MPAKGRHTAKLECPDVRESPHDNRAGAFEVVSGSELAAVVFTPGHDGAVVQQGRVVGAASEHGAHTG